MSSQLASRPAQPSVTAAEPASPELAELDARREVLRRNLDGLLQKYTDDHPDVVGARRVLRQVEQQRRELQSQLAAAAAAAPRRAAADIQEPSAAAVRQSGELRISLAEAEATVASLQARVGEYSARAARLRDLAKSMPRLEEEAAQLNRDYEVNRKNYESLVGRRESANLSSEMQSVAGIADFRLVDPPRVGTRPVSGDRALLLLLVLGAAIGSALTVAYLAQLLRPTCFDARSLAEIVNLPLLGTISLTVSEDRRRRERASVLRFSGASAAFVAAYAACAVIIVLRTLPAA